MEVADEARQSLDYFPRGERIRIRIVESPGGDEEVAWPPRLCQRGQTGRIVLDRLDESCLLVGVVERDQAERIPPSLAARALGWDADGLRNPGPPAPLLAKLQFGLY